MAETSKNNIYYNDNEDSIADVLEDMKKLAESTDNAIEKAKYNDIELKNKNTTQDKEIAQIKAKDTTQDSLIEELQTKVVNLEAENTSLKNQIPSGEATGNPIHLTDSSDMECEIVPIGGVKEKLYLPKEYTQLEYIESSGTQYIDTNYKVTNNTKIYFKGFMKSAGGYAFGSGVNGQYVDIGLGTANYLYYRARIRDTSSSNKTIDATIEIGETIREIILSQNDGFIIDGNTVGTFSEFSFKSDKNLYLFCWNGSTKADLFSNIRLQEFKIYENNILMRSFTPCYRKSDNAIGLYDTVNNVFYENLGTGNFVAGPEQTKSPDYPSEIVTVGQNVNIFNGEFRQGSASGSSTTRLYSTQEIKVKTGKTYTIFTDLDTKIYRYSVNLNTQPFPTSVSSFYDAGWKTVEKTTFTPTQDGYLGVPVSRIDNTELVLSDISKFKFKVVEGTEVGGYSPYGQGSVEIKVDNGLETTDTNYQSYTKVLTIQQEMLDGDYIEDVEYHEWGKYEITGNENWKKSSNSNNISYFLVANSMLVNINKNTLSPSNSESQTKVAVVLSNYFKAISPNQLFTAGENGICLNLLNNEIQMRLGVGLNSDINTLDKFKAFLKSLYDAGTPVIVYYKLATPKALELTEEQKAILNSFYTYKGITNISVDGIGKIKIIYKQDQQTINKNYEDRLAALEEYSTEEQVVGKWIDGKTLYKKTIIATSPTVETDGTAVNVNIDISSLNAKFIGVLNAYSILDTGDIIGLPYTNNLGRVFRTYANTITQRLLIGTNSTSFSRKTCYITLIYTKTTD